MSDDEPTWNFYHKTHFFRSVFSGVSSNHVFIDVNNVND